MKRDLLGYILLIIQSCGGMFVFTQLLIHGEVHGFESILWVRIAEFLLPIIALGLGIERLIHWTGERSETRNQKTMSR